MKKFYYLTAIFLVILPATLFSQDVYIEKDGKVSFFSEAPLEDIDAKSEKMVSALNVKTNEIFFKVSIKSFRFENSLMQEHFNENYMESEDYPFGTFKGKVIDENIDLSEAGTYKITVKGILNIHGVDQEREIEGVLIVEEGKITGTSEFWIKVADHDIEVPTLLIKNIAEEVLVKVNLVYEPNE